MHRSNCQKEGENAYAIYYKTSTKRSNQTQEKTPLRRRRFSYRSSLIGGSHCLRILRKRYDHGTNQVGESNQADALLHYTELKGFF